MLQSGNLIAEKHVKLAILSRVLSRGCGGGGGGGGGEPKDLVNDFFPPPQYTDTFFSRGVATKIQKCYEMGLLYIPRSVHLQNLHTL